MRTLSVRRRRDERNIKKLKLPNEIHTYAANDVMMTESITGPYKTGTNT